MSLRRCNITMQNIVIIHCSNFCHHPCLICFYFFPKTKIVKPGHVTLKVDQFLFFMLAYNYFPTLKRPSGLIWSDLTRLHPQGLSCLFRANNSVWKRDAERNSFAQRSPYVFWLKCEYVTNAGGIIMRWASKFSVVKSIANGSPAKVALASRV